MKKVAVFLIWVFACLSAASQTSPTLYFTDLISGPVGAIVTVYGANLQPSVTVNGVAATVVASSAQKVSFVVPNTTSGAIIVGTSNSLPFTVRSGNIYYVSTKGSDTQSGSQTAPWATIPHAFNTAACGDIIYALDGVSQTGLDNYGASLSVQQVCTQDAPLALVGYPGATVTIGSSTGPEYGIRNPDINNDGYNGMVFANLVIRANNEGLKTVGNQYWRIVGNDFSCPYGGGLSGCVIIDASSNIQFLGNAIHDTGAGGTKYYHSFYATTNSNHIEVGWNHIFNNQSCRGVQFYSTGGSPQFDLIVHDNIISDQLCDGINFSTIDATLGPVQAYNNLVYHVGLGGPGLDLPNEACIASLGLGASGGQTIFFGNTLADCGSAGGSTAGAITVQSGSPIAVLTSNLVLQNPGEPIYSPNTDTTLIQSNKNVLLTAGTAGVVDATYHPIAGGAAIGAGTALAGILYDLDGKPRPQSGTEDAGAYLYSAAVVPPSAPTALLSSNALNFGNQALNTTSNPQSVTLTNTGGSALSISSSAISGTGAAAFAETNKCGTSLAPSTSCTISVTFAPTSVAAYTATLSIADDASSSPQTVSLSGNGVASTSPAAQLIPTSLSFTGTVGRTTAAQTATLTNTGNAALTITGISLAGTNAGSFAQTNTCGTSLAQGTSCTLSVTFTPGSAGAFNATLSIADNAAGSPHTVALQGTATTGADFSINVSPTSQTIARGSSTSYTVTVTSTNGTFTQPVTLSATGGPPGVVLSFSPASQVPGSAGFTSTLTAQIPQLASSHPAQSKWPLAATALGLLVLIPTKRLRSSGRFLLLMGITALVASTLLQGCSSVHVQSAISGGGAYPLTISGTSGSLQHNATVELTVR